MAAQAVSRVEPPLIRYVAQVDNFGTFEVEIEVPGQPVDVEPVSTVGGLRCYKIRVYLDDVKVIEDEYPEGSLQHPTLTYESYKKAYILADIVDGDGNASDAQAARYEIRFIPSGYLVNFDGCEAATLSDCVFEGKDGGLLAKGSSLAVLDCEIILNVGGDFIEKDASSSVLEQNVKKTIRS